MASNLDADTIYDVVKTLLGQVEPVGESRTDELRLSNLVKTIEVTDLLLLDISQVTFCATRDEASMKKAGKCACEFIASLADQHKGC